MYIAHHRLIHRFKGMAFWDELEVAAVRSKKRLMKIWLNESWKISGVTNYFFIPLSLLEKAIGVWKSVIDLSPLYQLCYCSR